MTTLSELRPTAQRRIFDLVQKAGIDVADWVNVKGGKKNAAANPKYCYEWSFLQPGKVVVLNLWHADLAESARGEISIGLNPRRASSKADAAPVSKRRAIRMDQHLQTAFVDGLPVRVVLLEGIKASDKAARTKRRELDEDRWAVTDYDWTSGRALLVRGASPVRGAAQQSVDEELDGFAEGKRRWLFVLHRERERKLRLAKLEHVKKTNNGRLSCEVPHCEFDFREKYGELGDGFAHVHHLIPLADAPAKGRPVTLNELAVVCANCHAMVHRGGECRPLNSLIP